MVSRVRQTLGKVHSLRSAYYFFLTLRERVQWRRQGVLESYRTHVFEQSDPFSYLTSPEQAERFQSALRLLDSAAKGERFKSAFEIGCAEGIFTQMLASRCGALLAVDFSPAALARARERCAGLGVAFDQWDLSVSPTPSNLDLVVVMDVLELFFEPPKVRDARLKIVAALRPGGYLLLGNSRQNPIFESARWAKWLLRGGKRIADFFAEDPRLERIAIEMKGIFVNALYRRTDAP